MTSARRYQLAVRAIRSRHPSATHRDAQAVYRLLRRGAAAPLSAAHVRATRRSTSARLLTRARDLGSRTLKLSPSKQRTEERRAAKFNTGGKDRARGKDKITVHSVQQLRQALAEADDDDLEDVEIETSPDYTEGQPR